MPGELQSFEHGMQGSSMPAADETIDLVPELPSLNEDSVESSPYAGLSIEEETLAREYKSGKIGQWITNTVVGVSEGIGLHPLAIRWIKPLGYKTKVGHIWDSFSDDLRDSQNPPKAALIGAAGLGIQVADRLRLSLAIIPPMAVEIFEQTNNALPTGAAAGLFYLAWCYGVGGAAKLGLDQFPESMRSFEKHYPEVVDFAADAMPGLSSVYEESIASNATRSLPKRFGKSAWLNIQRAAIAMGTGSTGFIATAKAKGYPDEEVSAQNTKVSLAAGAGTFLFVTGIAQGIKVLAENGEPELAQDIVDTVGNYRYWLLLAAGAMALSFTTNRIKKAGGIRQVITKLDFRYPDRDAYHYEQPQQETVKEATTKNTSEDEESILKMIFYKYPERKVYKFSQPPEPAG